MNKLTLLAAATVLFAACNNPSRTSNNSADTLLAKQARNIAIVMEAQKGLASNDIDLYFKNVAPDYKDYSSEGNQVMTDIDSIKETYRQSRDAFGTAVKDLRAIASNDTVILLGTWTGTFKKEFMGVKPNNRSFSSPDAEIFVFNQDGKIISHRPTQSEALILMQLGLLKMDPSVHSK